MGKLLREAGWSAGQGKPRTAEPPVVGARCSQARGTFAHGSGLYSGQGLLCRYCMMYTMDWCHQYSITTARTCQTW